jgi:hypothetical protein
VKRFRIGHYLKTSLWLLPVLFVLAGVALSLITTSIDDGSLIPQSITGDPTAALQILYLISFSMLTLTGLVLSLVVVVVQFAMGIFSPRIVPVRSPTRSSPSGRSGRLRTGGRCPALPSSWPSPWSWPASGHSSGT